MDEENLYARVEIAKGKNKMTKSRLDIESSGDTSLKESNVFDKIGGRIQMSLAMFGLYYKSKVVSIPNDEELHYKPSILFVYNIFVLLLLWACFVKTVVAFFFNNELSTKSIMLTLIAISWQLQVSMNALITIKASHPIYGNVCNTYRYYSSKVETKLSELGIQTDSKAMKRNLLIAFIFGWICVLCNVTFLIVIFTLPPGSVQNTVLSLYMCLLPDTPVIKVILVILQIFHSAAWVFPVVYFFTIASILKCAFQSCNLALRKELTNLTDQESTTNVTRLSEIRQLHLSICKSVEMLDRDFKYLLTNLYVTSIPLACFIIYSLVKTQPDLFHTITYVFWAIAGDCCVIFASGFAASINKAVSSFNV